MVRLFRALGLGLGYKMLRFWVSSPKLTVVTCRLEIVGEVDGQTRFLKFRHAVNVVHEDHICWRGRSKFVQHPSLVGFSVSHALECCSGTHRVGQNWEGARGGPLCSKTSFVPPEGIQAQCSVFEGQENRDMAVYNICQGFCAVGGARFEPPCDNCRTGASGSPIIPLATDGDAENVATSLDVSNAIEHALYPRTGANLGEGQQFRSERLGDLDGSPEDSAVRGETAAILSDERETARLDLKTRKIERNRLCAAKSNLRERQEREELRRNIENWRRKVVELEKKKDE